MNRILTAVALAIALPAVANAQAAPAPEAEKKMDCCKDCKMDCCKDKAAMGRGEHDMKSGAKPPADAHQNHQ